MLRRSTSASSWEAMHADRNGRSQSPPKGPVRLRTADVLKHDGFDAHRLFVVDGVRGRFGDEAVPYLKARMHGASGEEILSWRRCLNVAPSLLQLLDRSLSSS